MKLELKEITIRELTGGYEESEEDGVFGYGGLLNIRPAYQREFIYNEKERNAVIDTVRKELPLNIMYWSVQPNSKFEVIDGQQRTMSICKYINGDFAIDGLTFNNLRETKQEHILNYKIMVYLCDGTESEKLEWFQTINIAGKILTPQELRNAVYSGSWIIDAKKYFSKNNCPAHKIGQDYLRGSAIRQEYFQMAIKWISNNNITAYMSEHQHDPNCIALWSYFQTVITWVENTFKIKRVKFMKGVDWGGLYNKYKKELYDPNELEDKVQKLISDDEVTSKKGIYPYILSGDEKYLSIRAFTPSMKQKVYEKQEKKCIKCKTEFEIEFMEADHITPWVEGGQTIEENCQILCKNCNRRKSSK